MLQRYVSKELTHFVGRGRDPAEQYHLLVEILRSGKLMPKLPFDADQLGTRGLYVRRGDQPFQDVYTAYAVCFCDIPLADLGLHMEKYSQFGLSFLKSFLVKCGANPVFYIAENSIVDDYGTTSTRLQLFENMIKSYAKAELFLVALLPYYELFESETLTSNKLPKSSELRKRLMDLADRLPSDDIQQEIAMLPWNLAKWVFCFLKFFDAGKSDTHPDNYYMEREWRIIGELDFELSSVYRIILPKLYAERFRKDLPQYYGQITFSG